MKKDIPYIHLMRVVACLMVVFLHSLPSGEFVTDGFNSLFKRGIMLMTSPCVPLFFMITGILILPIKTDIKTFYKKRIQKILYPLLIWGIIYATLPFFLGLQNISDTIKEILICPLVWPSQIGGILWYLYMLIGIYLIMPFISSKLYTDRNYQKLYLILWLLSSLVWLIQMYEPRVLGLNPWKHNIHALSYFWGYLGFSILGLYLDVNKSKTGGGKTILLYLITCFFMYISQCYLGSNVSHWISSFISIPSVILSVILFRYIRGINISRKIYSIIKKISSLSFGIYLSHMVIYSCMTVNIYHFSTSWILQILVFILTFLGAYFFSYILSKLSFSKYIIGI